MKKGLRVLALCAFVSLAFSACRDAAGGGWSFDLPTEQTAELEQKEQTEPTKPTEPEQPTPTEPTEPEQPTPTEPEQPEPTKPSEPEQPTPTEPTEPEQPKSPEVIAAEEKVTKALAFVTTGEDGKVNADADNARKNVNELPTFEDLKLVLEGNEDLKDRGWCFVNYNGKLGIAWKDGTSGEWKADDEGEGKKALNGGK